MGPVGEGAGPRVPRHVDELTPAWCTAALRPARPVVAVRVRTFAEGVGMLSVMARVELTYDGDGSGPAGGDPASVVVKLPPWRERNHGMGMQWGYFVREAEFYRRLAVAAPHTPAPRCYHVGVDEADRTAVLVLADHTDAPPLDQIAGCPVPLAERIVDAAARLHAAWWESPLLRTCRFVPALDDGVEDRSARLFREGFGVFAQRYRHLVPDAAFRAAERYGPQIGDRYREWAARRPHTLMHNDLRLDNVLAVPADGPPQVLFVDWQRIIRFHGACDVAYFVAGSLTIADRRAHEEDLLRRYHDGLLAGGVRHYPLARCRQDYRAAMLRWLGLATVASLIDVANDRGERLLATMVERHYTAAADHDVGALLD